MYVRFYNNLLLYWRRPALFTWRYLPGVDVHLNCHKQGRTVQCLQQYLFAFTVLNLLKEQKQIPYCFLRALILKSVA